MLGTYLRKTAEMPPHVLAQKLVMKVLSKLKDRQSRRHDLNNDTRNYFDSSVVGCSYVKIENIDGSSEYNRLEELARMYCNHYFDLLGSGIIQTKYNSHPTGIEGIKYNMDIEELDFDSDGKWLGRILRPAHLDSSIATWRQITGNYEHIDWQKDHKSGFRWSAKKWYKDQRITKLGADIKYPWELARLQHFVQMAVLATKFPERHRTLTLEFKNQILDFIATNPPKMGVNWACTMDVSIRVANMVIAYDLFCQLDSDGVLDRKFKKIFANSIYEHQQHIVENLEWSSAITSNHYLADIAGLLIASLYTENIFPNSKQHKYFALDELKKEIFKQIYSDGTDFEASTCYHRLVLELFFYSTYWTVISNPNFTGENYCETAEKIFGKKYTERLYEMFDAVRYLLKPNGCMPQIGDNDSGQFVKLFPREVLDMRYLLALGAVFFGEAGWKIEEFFNADEDVAEILILYGEEGKKLWHQLAWSNLASIKSKAYPDSGWYVMRSGKDYCLISCGTNGQNGIGGHAHNDKLSFELVLNGQDIIVDPGTYIYSPEHTWRNRFRSVKVHATIVVENFEQDNLSDNLFHMRDLCARKCVEFRTNDSEDTFVGQVARQEYSCTRKVVFNKIKNIVTVTDQVFAGRSRPYYANLTLAPGIGSDNLSLSTDGQISTYDDWYSPEYGVKIATKRLEIRDYQYFTINMLRLQKESNH